MQNKKIFITRRIPNAGIKLLEKQKNFQVEISPHNRVLKPKELLEKVKGVDAMLCLLTDKIDGKVMDSAGKQLKIIANYAVGYNNIDIEAASGRNIMVTNTPGVLTDTVAEHAIGLILAIAQRIPEADKFTRAGKYKAWEPMLLLGTDLKEKILGIIGMGRIGQRVSEIMSRGFGMNIVYSDKFKNSKYKKVSLKKLLKISDVISVHVPLIPETHHLIGKSELKSMKPSAYLINTSRGPVINEKALVRALKKKQIKGAALDVFEKEPKLAPGLAKLDNIILTPHIASASIETREKMSIMASKNIIDALFGKKPKNLVSK
ncbi:D-glycerate dehydrogenase [bacterium]|nr:D-glycerate dehydrogenase [bacterium]|tara:strand:- start:10268 stop:11224 length:957 start_codon:yes stop_codon:yes gene_type:complete